MDIKIFLITLLAAVAGGGIIGILSGKHAVKRATSDRKPLLSFKERIIYGALLVLGAACIVLGVFWSPNADNGLVQGDMMGMDEDGMMAGEWDDGYAVGAFGEEMGDMMDGQEAEFQELDDQEDDDSQEISDDNTDNGTEVDSDTADESDADTTDTVLDTDEENIDTSTASAPAGGTASASSGGSARSGSVRVSNGGSVIIYG